MNIFAAEVYVPPSSTIRRARRSLVTGVSVALAVGHEGLSVVKRFLGSSTSHLEAFTCRRALIIVCGDLDSPVNDFNSYSDTFFCRFPTQIAFQPSWIRQHPVVIHNYAYEVTDVRVNSVLVSVD